MASQWLSGLANASTNTSTSGRYVRASHEMYNQENLDENRTPPSMRRTANRRAMPSVDASPDRSTNSFRSGNERLYEAYNDLHTLAQDFEKPFDAPAILVVGHQTDGKSGWRCLILFCCYLQLLAPGSYEPVILLQSYRKIYVLIQAPYKTHRRSCFIAADKTS